MTSSSTSGSSLLVDPLSNGPQTAGASTALPAPGSSVAELNLVSMLLSIQPGTSSGGAAPVSTPGSATAGSPSARVEGAHGVTGQNVVDVASQFMGLPTCGVGRRRTGLTVRASLSTSTTSWASTCLARVSSR